MGVAERLVGLVGLVAAAFVCLLSRPPMTALIAKFYCTAGHSLDRQRHRERRGIGTPRFAQ
jgi:hypothetical protein